MWASPLVLKLSRFMAVWPNESYDGSRLCSILGIRFIILCPQPQVSRLFQPFIQMIFPVFKLQQSHSKKSSNTASVKQEEQGEQGHEAEAAALTGSLSAQLGHSNPFTYDQLSLQTTERRINQIILLQVGTRSTAAGSQQKFHLSYSTSPKQCSKSTPKQKKIFH